MSKKHIWALVLIGFCAVVLIMTRGSVEVCLIVKSIKAATSFVLLGAISVGVVIGILFK